MTRSRVIVTGASGTVGSYLCRVLTESGYAVTAVSRRAPNVAVSTFLPCDLTSLDAVPDFDDVPVVHAAAITKDGWDAAMEEANIAMTRTALRLSRGPFILLSSSSVYDLRKASVRTREEEATGTYPFLNSYSRSKWRSEEVVRSTSDRITLILRPHAIYGENDSTLVPRIRRALRGGRLYLPRGGRVLHATTSLDVVSLAVIRALEGTLNGRITGNHAINVTDRVPRLLSTAISAAMKEGVEFRSIPAAVGLAVASIVELVTPRGVEPRISRYAVRQLMHERTYDLSNARELLGMSE